MISNNTRFPLPTEAGVHDVGRTYKPSERVSHDHRLCILCHAQGDHARADQQVPADDEPTTAEEVRIRAEQHERDCVAHGVHGGPPVGVSRVAQNRRHGALDRGERGDVPEGDSV